MSFLINGAYRFNCEWKQNHLSLSANLLFFYGSLLDIVKSTYEGANISLNRGMLYHSNIFLNYHILLRRSYKIASISRNIYLSSFNDGIKSRWTEYKWLTIRVETFALMWQTNIEYLIKLQNCNRNSKCYHCTGIASFGNICILNSYESLHSYVEKKSHVRM